MPTRDAKTGQFVSGGSGGPGRGYKATVPRSFLSDMERAWIEHGEQVIKTVIEDDPSTFLRIAASLVPRELLVRNIGRERIIDPEIARQQVQAMLADRQVPALGTPETQAEAVPQ